jgi:hypothetical protein
LPAPGTFSGKITESGANIQKTFRKEGPVAAGKALIEEGKKGMEYILGDDKQEEKPSNAPAQAKEDKEALRKKALDILNKGGK